MNSVDPSLFWLIIAFCAPISAICTIAEFEAWRKDGFRVFDHRHRS